MANTKITSLTELAATPANNDVYPIVDISDITMAATGTTKKIQASRILHTNGTANTLGANLNANGFTISGGQVGFGTISNFYASQLTNDPLINFDANDYILYSRANNTYEFYINGLQTRLSGTNGLQIFTPVSESTIGVDNVRIGVIAGVPRIIFEDAGQFQHQIDNSVSVLRFLVPGTVNMSISHLGNVGVKGTITCVDVVETSSQSEKENFKDINEVLGRLANIKAYQYNDKKDKNTKKIGLIAEEFMAEFPEVVSEIDILEGLGTRKVNGLNYSRVIPIVLQGLKELNKKYEDGLQELKDLKQDFKDYKAKNKLQ